MVRFTVLKYQVLKQEFKPQTLASKGDLGSLGLSRLPFTLI